MRKIALIFFVAVAILDCWAAPIASETARPGSTTPATVESAPPNPPVDQLIPWLLNEDQQLRGIPFSEVIFDTTGKKVLAFNPQDETDQRVAKQISAACDETVKRLNAPDSAIQNGGRINEVSSHFEDTLRDLLNSTPGLSCDFPHMAQDHVMRSRYPDLRIHRRGDCAERKVIVARVASLSKSSPSQRTIDQELTRAGAR
jgi:hypothetical protein